MEVSLHAKSSNNAPGKGIVEDKVLGYNPASKLLVFYAFTSSTRPHVPHHHRLFPSRAPSPLHSSTSTSTSPLTKCRHTRKSSMPTARSTAPVSKRCNTHHQHGTRSATSSDEPSDKHPSSTFRPPASRTRFSSCWSRRGKREWSIRLSRIL